MTIEVSTGMSGRVVLAGKISWPRRRGEKYSHCGYIFVCMPVLVYVGVNG